MKSNFNKILLVCCLLVSVTGHTQIDINRCSEEVKEDFSPRVFLFLNQKLLANASNANTLYLSHKQDLKIFSFPGNGIVTAAVDEKEEKIAVSYYNNRINVYDAKTRDTIHQINAAKKSNVMVFKGNQLLYGLDTGEVKSYNFNTKKESSIATHNDIVRGVSVLNDALVLSISSDGVFQANQTNKPVQQKTFEKQLTSIAISPNQQRIALGTFKGSVYILDRNFNLIQELWPHTSVITKLKFKNNEELISSAFDKKLVNTNIATGGYTSMYTSKDYIMTFDVSAKRLIYSDRSGNVRYYNFNCQ
ncbi:MAG: hypothetical protein AAF611_02960 [Bacteroidota bacterium]